MSDNYPIVETTEPVLVSEPIATHHGDGTLGEVSGTGAGVISGGVVGAAVAGPVGAVIGAVAGAVLGAAAGGAAHDIGNDQTSVEIRNPAEITDFENESYTNPADSSFPSGQALNRTDGEILGEHRGQKLPNSANGPSEAERVMLPPGV